MTVFPPSIIFIELPVRNFSNSEIFIIYFSDWSIIELNQSVCFNIKDTHFLDSFNQSDKISLGNGDKEDAPGGNPIRYSASLEIGRPKILL